MTYLIQYDIIHEKGGIIIAKTKAEIQREYSKRTNYAAQRKYDKNNTKRYSLVCMKNTEADIIEQLEKQENKAGYIKKLIRDDISRGN